MENKRKYEDLLSEAYKNVKETTACERFEIKKVEGHHEGTKTIVSNFVQVAGCLRRSPEHVAKFLFRELATSGEIDGDRLILTRKITSKQICEKLEKYANLFVICGNPVCKKPDTEICEEQGKKMMRCLACGTKTIVVDK